MVRTTAIAPAGTEGGHDSRQFQLQSDLSQGTLGCHVHSSALVSCPKSQEGTGIPCPLLSAASLTHLNPRDFGGTAEPATATGSLCSRWAPPALPLVSHTHMSPLQC